MDQFYPTLYTELIALPLVEFPLAAAFAQCISNLGQYCRYWLFTNACPLQKECHLDVNYRIVHLV